MPPPCIPFWISTPVFTVIAEIDALGLIRHTAPYMRRSWMGKPWAQVKRQLLRQWGTALKVQQLPQGA